MVVGDGFYCTGVTVFGFGEIAVHHNFVHLSDFLFQAYGHLFIGLDGKRDGLITDESEGQFPNIFRQIHSEQPIGIGSSTRYGTASVHGNNSNPRHRLSGFGVDNMPPYFHYLRHLRCGCKCFDNDGVVLNFIVQRVPLQTSPHNFVNIVTINTKTYHTIVFHQLITVKNVETALLLYQL